MQELGPDNAFWIDGEWISWASIPDDGDEDYEFKSHLARLEHEAQLRWKYPNADIAPIPHFRKLLQLAEDYHEDTGQHLQVYGDIGELFGAITYGIKLHRSYAQGSDGWAMISSRSSRSRPSTRTIMWPFALIVISASCCW